MAKSVILSGFKEDCEELIARFDRANDIRFETFCEIWKEMKFSLIFTGRPNFLELLEFCEEALNICKQFLLVPPRFKERIGGLYLLYGIYYKMPVDQFKIRVKMDDWRNIMELHAEMKEAEHLDANYILCKLIVDNAFHFSIFDKEFGLERQYRIKYAQCFNPYSVLPTLKDLSDKHQLLPKISELSKLYEQKKEVLKLRNKSDAALKLFSSNIAEDIINDVQAFEEYRRNQQTKHGPDSEQSCSSSTSLDKHKKTLKGQYKKRPLIDDDFVIDCNDSDDDDEYDDSASDSENDD